MQLGTLDLARSVARAYRITGEQPDIALEPTLLPVINAITLDESPWHGKRGFATGGFIDAVAAQYARVVVGFNIGTPPGVRAVIRYFRAGSGSGANTTQVNVIANYALRPQPMTVQSAADWDQADRGSDTTVTKRPPLIIVTRGTDAILPDAYALLSQLSSPSVWQMVEHSGPFIIGPDQALELVNRGANQSLQWSVYGDIYGV